MSTKSEPLKLTNDSGSDFEVTIRLDSEESRARESVNVSGGSRDSWRVPIRNSPPSSDSTAGAECLMPVVPVRASSEVLPKVDTVESDDLSAQSMPLRRMHSAPVGSSPIPEEKEGPDVLAADVFSKFKGKIKPNLEMDMIPRGYMSRTHSGSSTIHSAPPGVSPIQEDEEFVDFTAVLKLKKIKPNPEMDLIIQANNMSRGTSGSTVRSLKLTQVEKNFYFSNVREIFEEVLQDMFVEFREGITDVIAIIMEYFENAKTVSFSTGDTQVFLVEPMGSEHRAVLPATHLLERANSLDKRNRRPAATEEEKRDARTIYTRLDSTEFPDAYTGFS